jgi:tripartite-type tricarboxylate transporter receptor subunit TctC
MRTEHSTLQRIVAGGLSWLAASLVHAQAFPAKDVRFVNPFPPGGTSDMIGRFLGEQFAKQLGKQVVVENKTGANGAVAAADVAKAAPDGHTILLASMSMMTVTPQMVSLAYDVERDFAPLGNVAGVYNILVVKSDSTFKTWQDVAEAGRKNPDKHTCATVGSGSSQQLSCALFMSLTGAKLTQVPYRGGAPAIVDITGGRVDMMFGNMPEFMGHIRGGTLRPIAFGASDASPLLPEVPVMSRTGLKDFVIHNWFGLVGPGGMSADLQKRWNDELNRALAAPEIAQRFRDNGLQILGGTPAQFLEQMKSDRQKWGKVIKDFNIKPE